MDKIVVKHSVIEINNYDPGDSPQLENFFSIYDPVYHIAIQTGMIYKEEERKLLLPRGMDIPWLERIFHENAVINHYCDSYATFDMPGIRYLTRDERQKETLLFMIGEGKYKYTGKHSQLSVNLNTGAGKTFCSIGTMCYLGIRSIVITSRVDWLEQWKLCIHDYTDLTPQDVFFIRGSGSIVSLLKKSPEELDRIKVLLVTHATLTSYGERNGWGKVTELFKYLKIGLKFYDEAHLNFDNMCAIDYHTNTFRTYYVTATLERSQWRENIIFGNYFKNIPSIDLFDEEVDPRTSYTSILFSSHPTPQEIHMCKNQYGLDRNKYISYITGNQYFYNILRILMEKIMTTPGRILIYIGINEAIDRILSWLDQNYSELGGLIGVYTSTTPPQIKRAQLDKKIILSTTKSCGAAVDIANLRLTIVLAEPFKSAVLARQTLGRTREYDTEYIEVVDTAFYQIKNFYTAKKPIFDKYATSCKEIRITDQDLDNKVDAIMNKRMYPMLGYRIPEGEVINYGI